MEKKRIKWVSSSDPIKTILGLVWKLRIKIISSRIANSIRSKILNDQCQDTGCSLKVFDKDMVSLTKFIESLSSVQFMKLTDFFNSMPSVSCTIDYKCACGKDNTQELKGLQSFFT